MDKKTYKAARRSVIVNGIKELLDGLYGLRLKAVEEEFFESLMEEDVIEFIPEDEDER